MKLAHLSSQVMRRNRAFLVVWAGYSIGLFVVTLVWVFTNPLLALPDEPYHMIISEAAARLQFSPPLTVPRVPLDAHSCFAIQPTVPADCASSAIWYDEPADYPFTFAGYPPVFYTFAGLPSMLFSGVARGYSMRVWSGFGAALIVGCGLAMVSQALRNKGMIVLAFASLTPSAVFYFSGVNPSSLAISGSSLAVLSAIAGRLVKHRPMHTTGILIGLTLLSVARADSILWVPVVGFLILFITDVRTLLTHVLRRWPSRIQAALLVSTLLMHQFLWGGAKVDAVLDAATVDGNTWALMKSMSDAALWHGWHAVAYFGWLDVTIPFPFNQLVWLTFMGFVFLGLIGSNRGGLATLLALGMFICIPIFLIAVGRVTSFQGRYLMPLLPVILSLGLLARSNSTSSHQPFVIPRLPLVVLSSWMVLIHLVSIWVSWRRHAVGLAGPWVFWESTAWRAPIGLSTALIVFFLGVAILVGTTLHASRGDDFELNAHVAQVSQ